MTRPPRTFVAHPRHPLTGKQFTLRARTKRELEAYLAHLDKLREGLRLGTLTDHEVAHTLRRLRKHGRRTLEQAARAYMERPHLSPNTRRRVASNLATHLRELASLPLEALEAPRLAAWLERCGRSLTGGTLTVLWRTLRAVMRFALERGWIDRCPWGSWRPTLRGKASSRLPREAARHAGELRALLDAARELDELAARREPLACSAVKIAAAAFLGLRAGELAGLRWSDVDAAAGVVAIVRQGGDGGGRATKARRVDVIAAVSELFEALEDWRLYLEQVLLYAPEGPVFPCAWRSVEGRPLPYLERAEVLTRAELRAAVERAGLPHAERWTPHSLRDTFVTLEAEGAAGDLAAVAERSRHASIGSLVRYLRARTREPAPPRMLLNGAKSAPRLKA
jgi:integrase